MVSNNLSVEDISYQITLLVFNHYGVIKIIKTELLYRRLVELFTETYNVRDMLKPVCHRNVLTADNFAC